jgi:hypothetical protein
VDESLCCNYLILILTLDGRIDCAMLRISFGFHSGGFGCCLLTITCIVSGVANNELLYILVIIAVGKSQRHSLALDYSDKTRRVYMARG